MFSFVYYPFLPGQLVLYTYIVTKLPRDGLTDFYVGNFFVYLYSGGLTIGPQYKDILLVVESFNTVIGRKQCFIPKVKIIRMSKQRLPGHLLYSLINMAHFYCLPTKATT